MCENPFPQLADCGAKRCTVHDAVHPIRDSIGPINVPQVSNRFTQLLNTRSTLIGHGRRHNSFYRYVYNAFVTANIYVDVCTLSNYRAIRTTNIDLDLTITFPTTPSTPGTIAGTAKHSLLATETIDHVVFDTSFLKITNVTSPKGALKYTLGDRKEPYGSALTIHFSNQLKEKETTEVSVEYETTDACTAVQWLNPEQTFGGKYPFMFVSSLR